MLSPTISDSSRAITAKSGVRCAFFATRILAQNSSGSASWLASRKLFRLGPTWHPGEGLSPDPDERKSADPSAQCRQCGTGLGGGAGAGRRSAGLGREDLAAGHQEADGERVVVAIAAG